MSDKLFSSMPNIGVPSSRIPMALPHKGSCMFGKLIPLDGLPVLPGDHIKVDCYGVIRMSTPIAPIMDDIEANLYTMFVPSRLVWKNFEKWFTTGSNNVSAGGPIQLGNFTELPKYSVFSGIYTGCIADYFGKPIVTQDNTKAVSYGFVSALKERAYFKAWADWFIPQQFVTASPRVEDGIQTLLGSYIADGVTTSVHANSMPLPVSKSFDYFTAALLSPQYATAAVTIPLGTSAPVMIDNPTAGTISTGSEFVVKNNVAIGPGEKDNAYLTASGGSISPVNLVADLSQAASATVNALREAFSIQKYCERASFGNRFFEVLKAHFAVTSPDARLQRTEYIGHKDFLVNVDQVVTTAGYQAGTSTLIGQPGAISVTGFNHYLGHKSFVEPGYLLTMLSTRQKHHTYSQGIMREDAKLTKFEFYSPEFANLGDQATLNEEIFLNGDATDKQPWGYQEHWAEDRYRPARVSGILNPNVSGSLDYWTLADKYASRPSLSAAFIFENRDNIARALTTSTTGPDFIFDIVVKYTADREMPVHVIPGLIDHFGTH